MLKLNETKNMNDAYSKIAKICGIVAIAVVFYQIFLGFLGPKEAEFTGEVQPLKVTHLKGVDYINFSGKNNCPSVLFENTFSKHHHFLF